MTFVKKSLPAAILLFILGACGTSSADRTPSDINPAAEINIVTTSDALNIGSASFAGGTPTGLPFAVLYTSPDDPDFPTEITVRLVRVETDYTTDETSIIVSDEVLSDLFGGTDLAGKLTYNGELVTFSPDGLGPLNNGQTLEIEFSEGGDVQNATIADVYSYGPGDTGFDSDGFFIIGFETSPDGLIGQSDETVTYFGVNDGYGNLLYLDGDVIETGIEISVTSDTSVNFYSGEVSGVFGI